MLILDQKIGRLILTEDVTIKLKVVKIDTHVPQHIDIEGEKIYWRKFARKNVHICDGEST